MYIPSIISAIIYALIYALVLDSKNKVLTFNELEVRFDYGELSMNEDSQKLESARFRIRFGMSKDPYVCTVYGGTGSSWCRIGTEDYKKRHSSTSDLHLALLEPLPRMGRSWIMRKPKVKENVQLMFTYRGPGAELQPTRLFVEIPAKSFDFSYKRKDRLLFAPTDLPLTLPAQYDYSSQA